jgi:hypothetical protein
LIHLILIQIPSYGIIYYYYQMDFDVALLAFILFNVTGTVNHTIYVVKNFSLFETSMKSFEKCIYFENIQPEDNYTTFDKDA